MTSIILAATIGIILSAVAAVKYRSGKNFFIGLGITGMGLLVGYVATELYNDFKFKSKYKLRSEANIKTDVSTSNSITWVEAETIILTSERIDTKAYTTPMSSYYATKTKELDFARITKSNPRDQPQYFDTS